MDRKRTAIVIIFLCAALVKLASVPLVDIAWYPFIIPADTYEWFSQALYYLGEPATNYFRPPFLSFIIAGQYACGLERFIGVVPVIFSLVLIAAVYVTTRAIFDDATALLAAVLVLLNKQIYALSFYLNPDLMCVTIITLSVALCLTKRPVATICAWGIAALSFYAQNAVASVIPIICVSIYTSGRRFYERREHCTGIAVYALLLILYFLFFFNYSRTSGRNLDVLMFTGFSQLPFYLKGLLWETSWPGLLSAGIALILLYRQKKKELFVLILWSLPFFVFFAFFYRWTSPRFIVYCIVPVLILSAKGASLLAERINKKWAFYILAGGLLVYQNTALLNDTTTVGREDIIIVPGIAMSADLSLKSSLPAFSAVEFLTATLPDLISRSDFIVFPQETIAMAQQLNAVIRSGEYFSFIPDYAVFVHRIGLKLEVLSKRRYIPVAASNMDDEKRRCLVVMKRRLKDARQRQRQEDLENMLIPYMERTGGYSVLYESGEFIVYARKDKR